MPRLRPPLSSQTWESDGFSRGHATSTCCTTVSVLEVSHLRDGCCSRKACACCSAAGRGSLRFPLSSTPLKHLAVPPELRASLPLLRSPAPASGPNGPRNAFAPLEECIHATALAGSPRRRVDEFTPGDRHPCRPREPCPLDVAHSGCCFRPSLSGYARSPSRLCSVAWTGLQVGHCCPFQEPCSSMGFWFPFEASLLLPPRPHTREIPDPAPGSLSGSVRV